MGRGHRPFTRPRLPQNADCQPKPMARSVGSAQLNQLALNAAKCYSIMQGLQLQGCVQERRHASASNRYMTFTTCGSAPILKQKSTLSNSPTDLNFFLQATIDLSFCSASSTSKYLQQQHHNMLLPLLPLLPLLLPRLDVGHKATNCGSNVDSLLFVTPNIRPTVAGLAQLPQDPMVKVLARL